MAKLLEIIGCKVKNTKRFYIMNPTNSGYEFTWKREDRGREVGVGSNFF